MKLTRVRLVRYRIPFVQPYVTFAGTASHREGFIVRLESDTGVSGLGEASLLPHVMFGTKELGAKIQDSARSLLDCGLETFIQDDQDESLTNDPLPWAPLSIAAWDLLARSRGLPLAYVLNPGASARAAVNALIGAGSPEAVRRAAAEAKAAHYRTVKLKVGVAGSVEAERERVAACREAIGPTVRLRLDANGAWSEEQAIETLQALIPFDIEYVEQPVTPGDVEALRRVRDAVLMRTAADEDVTDRASAQRILDVGAADVLILKPLQAGGIGRACLIAADAARGGVDVTITTSIDTGIGTAAALHLAAARGGRAHGLSTLSLLEDDLILDPGLPVERAHIELPAAPGLGVELDEAALARYAVEEWEVTS